MKKQNYKNKLQEGYFFVKKLWKLQDSRLYFRKFVFKNFGLFITC